MKTGDPLIVVARLVWRSAINWSPTTTWSSRATVCALAQR